MKHVSEGRLLAYLDGQLAPSERAEVAAHLEVCEACRHQAAKLRAASESLSGALRILAADAAVDDLAIRRAAAAVRARESRLRNGAVRRTLLRAAVLILGFTALASAAVPGSPIHGWLRGAWSGQDMPGAPEKGLFEIADEPDPETSTGVSIRPVDGRVDVRIVDAAPGAVLRVRLVDEPRALVRAEEARYRTGPGTIDVLNARRGEIVLDLPRSAASATVSVDGRVVVTQAGTLLYGEGSESDGSSELLLPLDAFR